jgi:hypothetical protein
MAKQVKNQIKSLAEVIVKNEETTKPVKKTSKKNTVVVKFKKLTEEAIIPTYAHEGDIGLDIIYSILEICLCLCGIGEELCLIDVMEERPTLGYVILHKAA